MSESTDHTIQIMLQKAQSALKAGQKTEARQWAQQILQADAQNEDAYLILAAISTPRESIPFLTKVLEINPQNKKARSGLHWAIEKMREEDAQKTGDRSPESTKKIKTHTSPQPQKAAKTGKKRPDKKRSSGWAWILFLTIVLVGITLFVSYGLPYIYAAPAEVKDPRP